MTTFLTADTHFGHPNILIHCARPFRDVDHMNRELIARWNAAVNKRDDVWHLGDFGMLGSDEARQIFEALNGRIRLIIGNHDLDKRGRLHKSIRELPWTVPPAHMAEIKHEGRRIILSHYAGLTWNSAHHGSLQAFGHSHGQLAPLPGSIDVGVDNQQFRPISVAEFVRQADFSLANYDAVLETALIQLKERRDGFHARRQSGVPIEEEISDGMSQEDKEIAPGNQADKDM